MRLIICLQWANFLGIHCTMARMPLPDLPCVTLTSPLTQHLQKYVLISNRTERHHPSVQWSLLHGPSELIAKAGGPLLGAIC